MVFTLRAINENDNGSHNMHILQEAAIMYPIKQVIEMRLQLQTDRQIYFTMSMFVASLVSRLWEDTLAIFKLTLGFFEL